MLQPEFREPRPENTVAAIKKMWGGVTIERCTEFAPAVERLLAAIRKTHVNGGAFFEKFRFQGGPEFLWFMSRNRWYEIEFAEHFLKSSTVAAALPEVCHEPVPESFGFEWGSAFTMSGELASQLANGGAYVRHDEGAGDAFAIAEDFRKWLFGDRFMEIIVAHSSRPWSDWFGTIAWDHTYLVIDKRFYTVSVIAISDYD